MTTVMSLQKVTLNHHALTRLGGEDSGDILPQTFAFSFLALTRHGESVFLGDTFCSSYGAAKAEFLRRMQHSPEPLAFGIIASAVSDIAYKAAIPDANDILRLRPLWDLPEGAWPHLRDGVKPTLLVEDSLSTATGWLWRRA